MLRDELPANDVGDTEGVRPTDIGIDHDPRDIDTRDRNDDLPERLGERLENGSSSPIATGGSDVLPDVEPPDTTM